MARELIKQVELVELGCDGKLELISKADNFISPPLPLKTLPFGLPPMSGIMHSVEGFLTKLDDLPIHDLCHAQRYIPREHCPESLISCGMCPVNTTLVVERDTSTGELIGYKEDTVHGLGQTAQNSLSLTRAPTMESADVKGSAANYPFWPGGWEEPKLVNSANEPVQLDFEKDLLSVAPGLPHGMVFTAETAGAVFSKPQTVAATSNGINLASIFAGGVDDVFLDDCKDDDNVHGKMNSDAETNMAVIKKSDSIDDLVKVPETISEDVGPQKKSQAEKIWATEVDSETPLTDFHQQVPHMAREFQFELDVFQKQAILHLEKGDSVLVAAHTSAGKTVVAEYAIALSYKHLRRTIYTSPIKALSNQKYHDFKEIFGDVGLVTGDVQIGTNASCLIMTTEILKSMLYNGVDFVRDVEWVIFDEVHYINDFERGVVWEETLIMLPETTNIILLSATVPNRMEFASWVGMTKGKQIYVISTKRRPVPLEHFLYTGNSRLTSSELFPLVDKDGNFLQAGYRSAVAAKEKRASAHSQQFGRRGTRGDTSSQDKNVWLSVIELLRKTDKLPVIAFVFSKRRLEDYLSKLQSVDLTTKQEKSHIHTFFAKCIKRLKGNDQQLFQLYYGWASHLYAKQQVLQVERILQRGFGVHHSGILPILREVVEMLFQRGFVKILFATETFAMGVNMPARTVVFDSIYKYDGNNIRNLLSGEYIQMAGRAGRRKHDTTGTVIILCKGDVPESSDLYEMMLGRPTQLESQFRLTYSMIFNLLRVDTLRVEDMLRRSFSEFSTQMSFGTNYKELRKLEKKCVMGGVQWMDCHLCSQDVAHYHKACSDYHRLRRGLQEKMSTHPAINRILVPGRLVVLSNNSQKYSFLGVVLDKIPNHGRRNSVNILVLCDKDGPCCYLDGDTDGDSDDAWPVRPHAIFVPESSCWQKLVSVQVRKISVISSRTIQIKAERILKDIWKREQHRFKDDSPGPSVIMAAQQLWTIAEMNRGGLVPVDPVKDFRMKDIDTVELVKNLQLMRTNLDTFQCLQCSMLEEHLSQYNQGFNLEKKCDNLRFLLSGKSLQLQPEYKQRIELLRRLQYVNSDNALQMKGKVACGISTHQLITTELIFDNMFSRLPLAATCAMLSCMVFEQKNCPEIKLDGILLQCQECILKKAEEITSHQKDIGMQTLDMDFTDSYSFGLMQVVYDWAEGKSFHEIMSKLRDASSTDEPRLSAPVQEGVVVRCIQRLLELLSDIAKTARIIGDRALKDTMEEAIRAIKRDIVFAASLYVD